MRYHIIRGTLDTQGVNGRMQARSRNYVLSIRGCQKVIPHDTESLGTRIFLQVITPMRECIEMHASHDTTSFVLEYLCPHYYEEERQCQEEQDSKT